MIIPGDLSQGGLQASFDSLLAMFNLKNHVTFITHRSGFSLDLTVINFSSYEVHCSPLGCVGSSDHEDILTKIKLRRIHDERVTHMP